VATKGVKAERAGTGGGGKKKKKGARAIRGMTRLRFLANGKELSVFHNERFREGLLGGVVIKKKKPKQKKHK